MKFFLITFLICSFPAFAQFKKITITNLDLDYVAPYGKGTVEKFGLGMLVAQVPYEIEVLKTADTFELTSPYLEFSWINPLPFFYELETLKTQQTSVALGTLGTHFVKAHSFMFRPKGRGEYKADLVEGKCEGNATGSFMVRVMEDCRKEMSLNLKRVDFPEDFFVYRLLQELPHLKTIEIPGDHIALNVREGNFSLQLYLKYWVYAGVRSQGFIKYENNHKTMAIRVDQIKFGYLNVTNIVMKKMQDIMTDSRVKISPPWIRIQMERK